VATGGQSNILSFKITMNDTGSMNALQAKTDLAGDGDSCLPWKTAATYTREKGVPLKIFHDKVVPHDGILSLIEDAYGVFGTKSFEE
jgi:hypothetical protein